MGFFDNLFGFDDMIKNQHIKYSLDKDFIIQNNNIYILYKRDELNISSSLL